MKRIFQTLGVVLSFAVLMAGCKKDDETPQPGTPGGNNNNNNNNGSGWITISEYVKKDAGGVYHVTDLPGNATSAGGTPVFFSFATHAIVDSSKKLTDEWDICFDNIYNSFVKANNPGKATPPGPEGTGRGALVVVKTPFDNVTEAPADEVFNASDSYAAWDGTPPSHIGWYNYDMEKHVMRTIAGRTIVIRTAKGKYAKLEMVSLYKGNPENPTTTSPAPYLTFRYWIQEDGSRNLKSEL